ncbi:hypothetical protein HELRODRAFT_85143, partial [Helobdella robusta]|uniref:Gelsolin-like domain-containing protein n=1 Tax=Helobdella robusta TaxID=6412 RepID=T1G5T3_HELRO
GLVKAKTYNWKDTNLEFFGSKEERRVKKESAQHEPAWQDVGKKTGLKIWRIVKFKVTDWPEEDYGKFYNGDSYIVLNTFKGHDESQSIKYDAHFWIGSNSTQDEYATAAYKTVELDNYLDDAAIQHREVEGFESELFLSYFPSITIMEGGADSGFRKVGPTEYKPRLLHFSGFKQHVTVREVALHPNRVVTGDVFILDLGLKLYQWNGRKSSKDERFKANQYLNNLKSERGGNSSYEVLEETDTAPTHVFFESLTGEDVEYEDKVDSEAEIKILHKVSDAAGHLKSTKVKEGDITMADLDSKDVFILDTGKDCFVWIGHDSSPGEKQNGIGYAHSHLMKTSHPLIPVHVIKEGQTNRAFNSAIAA